MAMCLRDHLDWVAECFLAGGVTPFLGAGVNLCDRPTDLAWSPTQSTYLPNAAELADYLARELHVPSVPGDLTRVAQFGATLRDSKDLYAKLQRVLSGEHSLTSVHRFLATLGRTSTKGTPPIPPQLIVSTNYDDLMERAFREAAVAFDLLVYEAEGQNKGRFWHYRQTGDEPVLIKRPNAYSYPFLVAAPVLLKIHGSIDRSNTIGDSYIITEDHYIDYLANRPLEQIIPAMLLDRIRNSRLLFLGYSLRDWNFRVFLRRLTQSQRLTTRHWAVSLHVDEAETKFWSTAADVQILQVSLAEYIQKLVSILKPHLTLPTDTEP